MSLPCQYMMPNASTLSEKRAGRSMPSSLAAQASPSRCLSAPCPAVASSRTRFWCLMDSCSSLMRVSRGQLTSSIACTHRTECSDTGLMLSVRPSANRLQHRVNVVSTVQRKQFRINVVGSRKEFELPMWSRFVSLGELVMYLPVRQLNSHLNRQITSVVYTQ